MPSPKEDPFAPPPPPPPHHHHPTDGGSRGNKDSGVLWCMRATANNDRLYHTYIVYIVYIECMPKTIKFLPSPLYSRCYRIDDNFLMPNWDVIATFSWPSLPSFQPSRSLLPEFCVILHGPLQSAAGQTVLDGRQFGSLCTAWFDRPSRTGANQRAWSDLSPAFLTGRSPSTFR